MLSQVSNGQNVRNSDLAVIIYVTRTYQNTLPIQCSVALPIQGPVTLPIQSPVTLPVQGSVTLPIQGSVTLPIQDLLFYQYKFL